MAGISKEQFIREYSKKVMEGNAALFVGAGLSRPAGFVDWKGLLREIAEDLGLQIDREDDLVALAQYHTNERGSRTALNEKLIEEFTKEAYPTENHALIARLPIHTVWTTNYDTLLEQAFRDEYKHVDVKITDSNITQSRSGVDVTVFKMHGDISQPQNAVLTKEDYETYEEDRESFSIRLKSDLLSLTFLFLGFSFTDPNIDYILSRIKNLMGKKLPSHYCIMKKPHLAGSASDVDKAEYEYSLRKLDLRISDLKRYGIQAVLIDDFSEIPEVLSELNRRAFFKNVFVSGSAKEGSPEFTLKRIQGFARLLGERIIKKGYNLVSGYGLGVGPDILVGALAGAYPSPSSMHERLILRPFPLTVEPSQKDRVFREWRLSMLSRAGFCVYLAGNKADPCDPSRITNATGVLEEFWLSREAPLQCCPVPIGASGFAAREIWNAVAANPSSFFGRVDVSRELGLLGNPAQADEVIIDAVFQIMEKVQAGRGT